MSWGFLWFAVTVGDSCVTEGLFSLSPGSLPLVVFTFPFFALLLVGQMRLRTWQHALCVAFRHALTLWDQSIPAVWQSCCHSVANVLCGSLATQITKSIDLRSVSIHWPMYPLGQGSLHSIGKQLHMPWMILGCGQGKHPTLASDAVW